MKKFYLIFALSFISYVSFADNEQVVVLTNTGSTGKATTASALGPVNPCTQLIFKVSSKVPIDFVRLEKYEWFVNGQL